jgi:hypothetical protein
MKPLQQLQPCSGCENCQPESQTREARAGLDWPAGRPMVESRPLGGVMKLVNIADLKSAA